MKALFLWLLAILLPLNACAEANSISSSEELLLSFLEERGVVFQQTDLSNFDIIIEYDERIDGYKARIRHKHIHNIDVDLWFDNGFQIKTPENYLQPRLKILNLYFSVCKAKYTYDDAVQKAYEIIDQITLQHDMYIRREKLLAEKSWDHIPWEELKWEIEFFGNERMRWFITVYYEYQVDPTSLIKTISPLFPTGIPDWAIQTYQNKSIEWLSLEIDAQTGEVVYCNYDNCFTMEN